ncbi:unnamed protein product [Effrenium voratum]|nr:unnamed protein product [Effrenium voratum]
MLSDLISLVDLSSTQISSVLSSLASNPPSWLDLSILGDLSSLAIHFELQWMDLSSTQILSDFSSLANNPELQWLDLSSTQISSDLSSLASPSCSGWTSASWVTSAASQDISSCSGWTSAAHKSRVTSAAWQAIPSCSGWTSASWVTSAGSKDISSCSGWTSAAHKSRVTLAAWQAMAGPQQPRKTFRAAVDGPQQHTNLE